MAMAALRDEVTTTEIILPLRILLVEDDEFDVAVFRRAFRKAEIPCEIIRCSRAEEVLEGLEGADVSLDLVVSDHHLPGMSGLDLCLELLSRKPPFALVLLTGGGSELVAIRALKAGVQEYIVKDSSRDYLEILPLVLRQVARRHRDRMARRRAEAALEKSRVGTLENLQDRLEGRLEHELRLPVGHLRTAIEGLAATVLDDGQQELLETLRGATDELDGLPGRLPKIFEGAARVRNSAERMAEAKSALDPPDRLAIDSLNPPRVLIAHTNPVVMAVTAQNIERLGLRYVPVSNGRQVLEALDREPFDLLLVELDLPGLDGFETTGRIREQEKSRGGRMPVVGLAVEAENVEPERCRDAGIDDVLLRPVSLEALRKTLGHVLKP